MNFLVLNVYVVTTLVVLFPLPSIFVVSIEITEYYSEERDALLQIRDSVSSDLNLHQNWTGPPCIDNESTWAGIACSNWHIVGIVLEGIQLTGSLPPAFLQNITFLAKLSFRNNSVYGQLPNLTNLVHLESVLFSYNRLTGSIPFDYIELPNLKELELQLNYLDGEIPPFEQPTLTHFNVSYNHLQGLIPKTDVLQKFPESCYDHNSNLCGVPLEPCQVPASAPSPPTPLRPPQEKKKKRPIWNIILIAAAGALALFIVMIIFLCYHKKRRGKEESKEQEGGGSAEWTDKKIPYSQGREDPERTVELEFFEKNVPVFDLDDLLRASAEVLGKGKLGTTYKATLESGVVVAVKRLKNMDSLSKKEFIQQMQLLGKMRHEKLVQIISFYYSKQEKLVIYEFIPNGNLFELLHENRGVGRVALNWGARLSIIKDIAKGLAFLHQSLPSHKVPHANLKSSNVLIYRERDNQSYHSKLTNYGFLPLLLPCRKWAQKLAVGRSPEFSQGKKLTHKADVYCFGIILLEIITGKMPGADDEDDLSEWVRMVVNNDWSTDILDVEIVGAREGHDEMLKLTQIALHCTDTAPEKRPKMSDVLKRIEEMEQTHPIETDP